ncbi:MAG: hypothetical protein KJ077_40975 [Anaerolineae bacterium]|nr:hypothetical protein [Anaerolineae bacterium]
MKQAILLILIITVTGLLAACSSEATQSKESQTGVTQAQAVQPETAQTLPVAPTFERQSNDEKAVTVEVTPLNLPQGGSSLDFEVAFNTHSVELDFDPTAISVLRDDQGQEYPALAWDGGGPTGHHRSGTLRFKVFDHPTNFVEVVIRSVAGVPERVFRWNLTEK